MITTGTALPSAGAPNGAGEREAVHSWHLDVRQNQIDRVAIQPGGTITAIDSRYDVVASALEDDPLKLTDAD